MIFVFRLHRQVLVDWTRDSSKELRLTEMVLSQDAKNYHAWQHRQWVMKNFNLFDQELDYVERLLEEDIRNNSAWNQRFFVLTHQNPAIQEPELSQELEFTTKALEKVPGNESAWNYFSGLIDRCQESEKVAFRQKCREFCKKLEKNCNDKPPVYLLATLVDLNKADDLNIEETMKVKTFTQF